MAEEKSTKNTEAWRVGQARPRFVKTSKLDLKDGRVENQLAGPHNDYQFAGRAHLWKADLRMYFTVPRPFDFGKRNQCLYINLVTT